MRKVGVRACVACWLALLFAVSPTWASEVRVQPITVYDAQLRAHTGDEVVYRDASGEDNAVTIGGRGALVTVSDDVALAAGQGCTGAIDDPRVAFCRVRALAAVSVTFTDGADRLLSVPAVHTDVQAGSGGDYIDASGSVGSSLVGGMGHDTLLAGRGKVWVYGGGGNDRVAAERASSALITCGGRAGSATVSSRALVKHCATVMRRGVASPEITLLGQTDVDPDGVVRVGVGCSQDQVAGCRGVLSVSHVGRVLARQRFTVAPGSARLYLPLVRLHVFTGRGCRTAHLAATLTTRDARGRPWRATRRFAVGPLSLACNLPSLLLAGPEAGW